MYRDGESILGRVKEVKEVNSQEEQSQKSFSRNIGQDFINDFVVADFPISREEAVVMQNSPNAYFF